MRLILILTLAIFLCSSESAVAETNSADDPLANMETAALETAPATIENLGGFVGDTILYKTNFEDTFVHLARDYKLGFVEMRAANPYVDPWVPGKSEEIILPTRHLFPDAEQKGIIINLPEMRLYHFSGSGIILDTYPIGVGREGLNTPTGQTSIVRKKEGPSWRPTERMRREDPDLPAVIEPGPDNPLGTHALYLGWPLYAIHGTDKPFGIGRRISSGCIRLYPEDITRLFEDAPIGTKVTVVDQPVKAAWDGDLFYIEVHPNIEQAVEVEERGEVLDQTSSLDDLGIIFRRAGPYVENLNWELVRQAVKERRGYPIPVAHKDGAKSERELNRLSRKNYKRFTALSGSKALYAARNSSPDTTIEEDMEKDIEEHSEEILPEDIQAQFNAKIASNVTNAETVDETETLREENPEDENIDNIERAETEPVDPAPLKQRKRRTLLRQ